MTLLDEQYEKALNLDTVRLILDNNPSVYVGGSVGLFLHGVRLTRWLSSNSDIDLWSPYFVNIQSRSIRVKEEQVESEKSSGGKDYKNVLTATNLNTSKAVNIDLGISPEQSWQFITYKGYEYRVNRLENIWAAKLKYKNAKHIADLKEALGLGVTVSLGL